MRTLTWRLAVVFAVAGCLAGCFAMPARPVRSQLEIRAIQTRTFQEFPVTSVLKAMLDVLQDEGFVIKNAVTELGLITATKEADVSERGAEIWGTVLFGEEARWNKSAVIEATLNLSAFGKDSKVRATFQVKTLNNKGEVVSVEEIRDPKQYQDFFSKVDKGLFVHGQGL